MPQATGVLTCVSAISAHLRLCMQWTEYECLQYKGHASDGNPLRSLMLAVLGAAVIEPERITPLTPIAKTLLASCACGHIAAEFTLSPLEALFPTVPPGALLQLMTGITRGWAVAKR